MRGASTGWQSEGNKKGVQDSPDALQGCWRPELSHNLAEEPEETAGEQSGGGER